MVMSEGNQPIGFLFDLDGVIIDSENEYTRIWAQIDSEFPTGIPDFAHKIKGCTLTKILTENYKDEDTREKVCDRLHQLEAKMKYDYLPFVKEFLDELKKRDLPCVLVTSSDNKKMEHLWEELPELKHYFRHIVTGSEVKTSKPSPEGYILGAGAIKCKPQNCVVIEDSLQGVMAGKNAGALVVGVAGTLPAETITPYSDILINSFEQVDLDSLIPQLKTR